MPESARRILIAELDSPAQAQRFSEKGARAAITELTGMLRVGVLVSGSILVTDAMLLDGEYFMTLGPEGVLNELGATRAAFPVTITGPDADLRAGLDRRRRNPDFLWSMAVARDGQVSREILRRWDAWIDLVESGTVRYEQQRSVDASLRTGEPPVASEKERLMIEQARLGEERYRSEAWRKIDDLDVDEETRQRIRAWWNGAYLRMLAENADADWVSFEGDPSRGLHPRDGDVDFPLSAGLLEWARTSSPATVAIAGDASVKERAALHTRPTWTRMKALAFAVTQVAVVESRGSVIRGSLAKLAVAILVVVLALPGLNIDAIDSPWTWVAFLGVIVTTVPFESLFALLALLKQDPRARLVLHGRGTS